MIGVGNFLDRRQFLQNSQTAEWKHMIVSRQHPIRDRGPADAMKAVAARDHVAGERVFNIALPVADRWPVAAKPVEARDFSLELDWCAIRDARGDQVLHHLLLA